ncbi:hypothetical protein ES332_D08G109700v1 [Gossypium tomentosum]|uniref:Uncharacterized protein n=1 Tax=Gossypium tomentosum TaxID=34277 RepID=A0A5D2JT37_GOSTO|nr:hypothetical protein ES332_D08G109700v1 [Gossypium tomentosum]
MEQTKIRRNRYGAVDVEACEGIARGGDARARRHSTCGKGPGFDGAESCLVLGFLVMLGCIGP